MPKEPPPPEDAALELFVEVPEPDASGDAVEPPEFGKPVVTALVPLLLDDDELEELLELELLAESVVTFTVEDLALMFPAAS